MEFLKATPLYKEMKILEYIESNPKTTGSQIAKVTGGASSMVAVYIDKLEEQGYLIKDYQSYNIVHYKITTKGIERKNSLSRAYYNELLSIYHSEKEAIEIYIDSLEEKI